jgi:hypothetical protein
MPLLKGLTWAAWGETGAPCSLHSVISLTGFDVERP